MKNRWLFISLLLSAASVQAVQVTPTYQVFEAKAGSTVDGELTLMNTEPQEVTLTPSVKDWFVLKVNKDFPAETWLKVPPEPFVLKPGESKKFKFSMKAPKKAQGELVGMLTFSSKPQEGSMVTMQLSLAMYLAIKGTEKIGHEIAGVSVKTSSYTEVAVLFVNQGNIHLRPKGWVYVQDGKGDSVLNVELQQGQPAFPGTPRAYAGRVNNYRLPEGRYTARIELEDMDRSYKYQEEFKKFVVKQDGKVEADK